MKGKVKFIVRKPKKGDMKDLINNYYDRYREVRYNPLLGVGLMEKKPSIKDEKKWFALLLKDIKQGNTFASVAVANGKIVGMCDVRKADANAERKHVGIFGIAINEDYRGIGIGKAIMRDCLRQAKKRYGMIILSVFHTNKPAIRLYKKLGFREYGRLPQGYIRGKRKITGIYMYLKLDAR